MKKSYAKSIALAAICGIGISANAQLTPKVNHPVQPQHATAQLKTSSPNLHHHHDGEQCLTDALTKAWIEQAGIAVQYQESFSYGNQLAHSQQTERATYTIPVIFHVVHNPNNPAENVSQQDIYDLLDAVNEDFSATNADVGDARTGFGFNPFNADIEFCLAQRDPVNNPLSEPGIHRVSTTEDFYDPDTEANKMKSSTGGNTGTEPWNRNKYINIWVCDITNGANSGTAGYAYKPTVSALPPSSIDGIVIDYNLGMTPSNRVLTHEIGHFLGLSHTWGNSNQGTGCSDDDGLTDTPNTAGPSFDFTGSCSGSQQTCSGIETQYENYMDYSNCTVMFTEEQSNLMSQVLQNSRVSLTTSNACTPVNPQAPTTDFMADITTVIQGGAVNFTDLSTDYPTSWSWTITPSAGVNYIGGTDATSENPVVQFTNTGLYTVELTASNGLGSDVMTKTDYIDVVSSGGGSTACDTLRNYDPNGDLYILGGVTGYIPGNENIGVNVTEWAEQYTISGNTQVRRLIIVPSRISDGGGSVTFNVYNDGGGEPGAIIGTQTVPLANIDELFENTIDFASPVSVNAGDFWVGYTVSYANAADTFALLANREVSPAPANETYMKYSGAWAAVDAVYGDGNGNALGTKFYMDVLTSNGGDPIAAVSFPTTETCEGMDVTMNAYGSQNTTDYYWNLNDGSTDYYYDEANLTTAFPEGNWTIQLFADGSCKTDQSGVYNLTVNPPLTGSYSTGDENCEAQDGSITFTITGGDGGALNYSINNGASFQAGNAFNGLESGDYNYIINDNTNCEISGMITVDNINNFNPTITPDQSITQGQSVNLSVTGGVSWSWYADNVDVGTSATISVSPNQTTTYYCNVIDANGCEANLEVTVTVTVGLNENDLESQFALYPNPNNGTFYVDLNNLQETTTFEIVDASGKTVYEFTSAPKAGIRELNLSVEDGMYLMRVKTDSKTATKKFTIHK